MSFALRLNFYVLHLESLAEASIGVNNVRINSVLFARTIAYILHL